MDILDNSSSPQDISKVSIIFPINDTTDIPKTIGKLAFLVSQHISEEDFFDSFSITQIFLKTSVSIGLQITIKFVSEGTSLNEETLNEFNESSLNKVEDLAKILKGLQNLSLIKVEQNLKRYTF